MKDFLLEVLVGSKRPPGHSLVITVPQKSSCMLINSHDVNLQLAGQWQNTRPAQITMQRDDHKKVVRLGYVMPRFIDKLALSFTGHQRLQSSQHCIEPSQHAPRL